MSKPRRIRKEEIGNPTDFVHIKHVGFGQRPSLETQRSLDLGQENGIGSFPTVGRDLRREDSFADNDFQDAQVERRVKGSRSSRIPRHHRSTTAGLFPDNSYHSQNSGSKTNSIESPVPEKNVSSLKPFGSLLNLSFLPLGLGKSSLSKSSSSSKAKRMSLLNLTSSNLFPKPNGSLEAKRESVHMTGFTRRRSFSNPDEGDDIVMSASKNPNGNESKEKVDLTNIASSRIPLAKLGRSKSTMAEFSKRPKLRLKILPPVLPPPSPPIQKQIQSLPPPPPDPPALIDIGTLPSPPPSPEPKPHTSLPTTPVQKVILRKAPDTPPRSRIIPLPSTGSTDSPGPSSPQYLTPAGGSSPQPNESVFPLLSPTIPPFSAPFFSSSRAPGTPPTWPLQPLWPSPIVMQQTEATIPEVPSPCQDEMETCEYEPVLSILENFISEHEKSPKPNFKVSSQNAKNISCALRDHIEFKNWSKVVQKLFQDAPLELTEKNPERISRAKEIYISVLTKTLELWAETAGNQATVGRLADVLDGVNHQAADMLRQMNINDAS